ncbi:MAG TPA: inorganic phosphate transporter [Terracidiphilus sp.]|nr:inorganic phosphate transporter [Terracidiphilus sp.]
MADIATTVDSPHSGTSLLDRKMKKSPAWISTIIVLGALLGGLVYIGFHVAGDLGNIVVVSVWPYVLLGVALLIALGFEFVNGFHDTANAVATVIYTHSLDPNIAVVWSGLCNLAGVLVSSGTVAFSIITLLPVELILKVSSGAGFAMVFALLIAAIIWNLSTWWFGLPASSSHTMVGSIIGVGVANQLMNAGSGTSGVDWSQATKVFQVLLISPLVGFGAAALLLLFAKLFILTKWAKSFAVHFDANHKKPLWLVPTIAITGIPGAYAFLWVAPMLFGLFGDPGKAAWKPINQFASWNPPTGLIATMVVMGIVGWYLIALFARIVIENAEVLFTAPEGSTPPPWPIRALLIFTCSGVSFAHGSNDGQKGMGLIMLILIGTVPTAYALNHAVTNKDMQEFVAASNAAATVVNAHVDPKTLLGGDPRSELTEYLRTKKLQPDTMIALRENIRDLEGNVQAYGDYKHVPPNQQTNVRNDMYVTSEALRLMAKNKDVKFSASEQASLDNYRKYVDKATKFIPSWVKVAVALALGLGTMVGWKRIVVTVGEKIGKEHLTYAQGACAELVAMGTIMAADNFGLPVSTTHVLNSGVAGTMAANRSGLQFSTIRNIAAAWVFTLPVAALLSGCLFWLFERFTH